MRSERDREPVLICIQLVATCQVGNGAVFGFTGTVAHYAGVAVAFGQVNGFQGFAQCTDLVDFDQQMRLPRLFDAFSQDFDWLRTSRRRPIELLPPNFFGQQFPAFPVVFVHTVFDGNNWEFVNQAFQVFGKFCAGVRAASASKWYLPSL